MRIYADTQTVELPPDDQLEAAVESFRMLADMTRIKLLWLLLQGEASVAELAHLTDASQTSVSQHLAKLRLAKLVAFRREGTHSFYSAADSHVTRVLLEALSHASHEESVSSGETTTPQPAQPPDVKEV